VTATTSWPSRLPCEVWRQIWSTREERLNKEVHRRTDVAGMGDNDHGQDVVIMVVCDRATAACCRVREFRHREPAQGTQ
jgi:transposase-like protein